MAQGRAERGAGRGCGHAGGGDGEAESLRIFTKRAGFDAEQVNQPTSLDGLLDPVFVEV